MNQVKHKEINIKNEYLNVLSVVAMFAVVTLHTNGCFWSYSTDRYWLEANIIESVMFFGVSIFFMISGATLLDYTERYSTKEFFKKRITKTVIPFLFWSIFGIGFCVALDRINVSDVNIKFLLDSICNTSVVVIYWFFIPLFCVYLSIPLFAAIPKQSKVKVFSYLVIIAFFLNCLIPFLKIFFQWIPYNGKMMIDVGKGYIICVLLGYVLHNCDIKQTWRLIIYLLGLAGLGIHLIGTYILSTRDGGINKTFKGDVTVQSVTYAVGIFVFIKYISPFILKSKIVYKIVGFIRKYTFGIYLLHWFVMTEINYLFEPNIYSLKYRLLMPFVIVSICIIIIEILRKIPLIRYIVP